MEDRRRRFPLNDMDPKAAVRLEMQQHCTKMLAKACEEEGVDPKSFDSGVKGKRHPSIVGKKSPGSHDRRKRCRGLL